MLEPASFLKLILTERGVEVGVHVHEGMPTEGAPEPDALVFGIEGNVDVAVGDAGKMRFESIVIAAYASKLRKSALNFAGLVAESFIQ